VKKIELIKRSLKIINVEIGKYTPLLRWRQTGGKPPVTESPIVNLNVISLVTILRGVRYELSETLWASECDCPESCEVVLGYLQSKISGLELSAVKAHSFGYLNTSRNLLFLSRLLMEVKNNISSACVEEDFDDGH
jgi:hypothetical protein